MRGNIGYRRAILTFLVASILISVGLGVYGPTDAENTQKLVTAEMPEIDKEKPEDYKTAIFSVWCFWGPDARVGVVDGVIHTRAGYLEFKDSIHDDDGIKREAIQIDYDPDKVSHAELYDFISETGQHREAHPYDEFVLASRHDQSYFLEGHEKLSEGYHKIYSDLGDFVNSTAVARVNGYLFGYGELDSPEDLEGLGLTEEGMEEVYEIWEVKKK